MERLELEFGGRPYSLETGHVARQANGSVICRHGDTMVLAAVVATKEPPPDRGFFPLSVDYREKAYAAGKIPGGFFKREGRPSEKETLSARMIDRPIRPLFPKGYKNEVQVHVVVLSSDQQNDADVLGMTAAATALAISDIPIEATIAGARVGRINGEFKINPPMDELEESDINLVIAATKDDVVMVEGGCLEVSEDDLATALEFGLGEIRKLIAAIEDLQSKVGKTKAEFTPSEIDPELDKKVREMSESRIREANQIVDKHEREDTITAISKEVLEAHAEEYPEQERVIGGIIGDIEKADLRERVLRDKTRADTRTPDEVRVITGEVGVLPRTHGSAIFTRGQTQSLTAVTLGTKMDEQRVDDLLGESTKSYMLHYNFPSYSVGEVRPIRGPGRREIGHGALAERALQPVIPNEDIFPYTVRVVSDVLESNGSSSMATVCAGSLALMDAGVPLKSPVAGIAMGLIKQDDQYVVLTDILGVEDHLGDMDFKVAGTSNGITAFQMDLKIQGLPFDILREALQKAKTARLHVLDKMAETLAIPRTELSPYAPRIIIFKIKPERIGDVIGPGGKNIRAITEQTGAKVDIDDDGTVIVASVNQEGGETARQMVLRSVEEPEVDKVYEGKVRRITDFGAFIEILPGTDGLLHISEMDYARTEKVEDVCKLGDTLEVKVIEIDPAGKVRLSRKALLPRPEGYVDPPPRGPRRGGNDGGRRGGRRDRPPARKR
ncbi:MAG: polyribonucleotide nucleotidyltransferase [candidate division Zixibacteria bacterium]|nr:polyribonucleotide nucleotidyltransferase [candidate division Zixibacteria bacterium]